MVDLLNVLFPADFVKACAGILLLVVLDLVLGVAVAIKAGKFEWSYLASFYRTSVVPSLLGWAVADILLRVGAYYQLPVVEQLQPIGTVALYGLVMVALLAQIGSKLMAVRGDQPAAGK